MILGIVGAEAAKFTTETEQLARVVIRSLLAKYRPTEVVSGACHLGGIDVWAIEEAIRSGFHTQEFPPAERSWEYGYKPRNIQIATRSDYVVCIALKVLPPHYTGMRFKSCYHCHSTDHVKSGGCWTMHYAKKLGKQGEVIVL